MPRSNNGMFRWSKSTMNKTENVPAAQTALLNRAKANSEATQGKYVKGSCPSVGSKGNVEMQGGAY